MSKRKRVPAPGRQALARRPAAPSPEQLSTNPALAFAQLARDKSIDPEKLERLIALQERILDRNAKQAFNAAFTAMSTELPVISRKGVIMAKDRSTVRSRYSKYEDIQRVCKPILKQFGFSIRHRTEWPENKPGIIRVVGILSHLEGHSEQSAFESAPDANDFRTPIQDQGSTVSYGRRYTTIDVLNLEQEGVDNDGQGANTKAGGGRASRAAGPAARPRNEPASATPSPTSPGSNSSHDQPISDKQRQRLWVLVKKAGRSDQEMKAWLAVAYNLSSTKLIKRRDYNDICRFVEGSGPLPQPRQREREPGEEG